MGPTQIKSFRKQLQNTKLSGMSVTVRDLKHHYDTFVTLSNNIKLCDKAATNEYIKQEYIDSLPRSVRTYMGAAYKELTTLDSIFTLAEEALSQNEDYKQKTDGSMNKKIENVNFIDVDGTEYVPVHALPTQTQSSKQRSSDPKAIWDKQNVKDAICYHCGGKGHFVAECSLINHPQTLKGKALWAQRNKQRGGDWAYDKNYYIEKYKQFNSGSNAATPTSVSKPTPPSPTGVTRSTTKYKNNNTKKSSPKPPSSPSAKKLTFSNNKPSDDEDDDEEEDN